MIFNVDLMYLRCLVVTDEKQQFFSAYKTAKKGENKQNAEKNRIKKVMNVSKRTTQYVCKRDKRKYVSTVHHVL